MTCKQRSLGAAGEIWHGTRARSFKIMIIFGALLMLGLTTAFQELSRADSSQAQAAGFGPDEVTIDFSKPFEKVSGYTYAEATMKRSFEREDGSTGEYSVPLILIYPTDGGNDVGVVDLPNSVFYSGTGFTIDAPDSTLQLIRAATDGYLFESGYTYASVQWNKEVTDFFGDGHAGTDVNHLVSGSIEQASDAWKIIRDASAVLRDPDTFLEAGATENHPQSVGTVLSSGYSQSGVILQSFLSADQNELDGVLAYDGHLVGTGGFGCNAPLDEDTAENETVGPLWEPALCDLPHHDDSKVISIMTQATVQFLGAPRFAEEPENWRQYELAGVAHTNPAITPDGPLILSDDRNPIVHIPVFRAAFDNLTMWITEEIEPPPSKLFEGGMSDDPQAFPELFEFELDEHGNALGGLRLPHMEREIDGRDAGAPLGTYTGLNPDFVDYWFEEPSFESFAGILTHITGTFTPFDDAELEERYPNHGAYVNQVARAAEHLYEAGYIVEEDKDAYVREAAQSSGDRRGQGGRR